MTHCITSHPRRTSILWLMARDERNPGFAVTFIQAARDGGVIAWHV